MTEIIKECVLYEGKICDGCMECEMCDLNPDKICDNCGRCLDIKDDAVIRIDAIVSEESK